MSEISDMSRLFFNTNIGSNEFNPDLSGWDTSNVTNMDSMFSLCYKLKEAPNFDTSNVTNMQWMFNNCLDLKEAPRYKTSNVTNMIGMFAICSNLREGDMSNWDVSKVVKKSTMFKYCPFPRDKRPKFKD